MKGDIVQRQDPESGKLPPTPARRHYYRTWVSQSGSVSQTDGGSGLLRHSRMATSWRLYNKKK